MTDPKMEWRLIETAPKDGTPFQARIPGYGDDNVIAWFEGLLDTDDLDCGGWCFVEDQEPPDCWTEGVCWEVNDRGERSIYPTHWKPRSEPPKEDE